MIPNVPMIDSGSATAGMIVARHERRNTQITPTTSTTESISVACTSSTEARIVAVRSATGTISIAAGIAARSCGKAALIRSTVSTMFAPGWRCTSSTTAGRP